MLRLDHRALERLFAKVKANPAGPSREWVVSDLVSELLTHALLEEELLCPLIRTAVPRGQQLADAATEENRALKETLSRLQELDPNDHEREILLTHLQGGLRDHVGEEEEVLFVLLRAAVDEHRLAELARDLEEARRTAPRPLSAATPEWG